MDRIRSAALAVCALFLVSCGGDDGPTGPSATFSPAGAWQLSVKDATDGTRTCSVTGLTVTFTESGGTLGGTIAGSGANNLSCVINGQTQTSDLGGNASLTSASRNGNNISFGFSVQAGPYSLSGTVQTDNRMTGTASITVSISGTPRLLSGGAWTATRQ